MSGLGLDAEFFGLQEALRGEYSLEREIGRGGMGIVYLARDVTLDRPVAIKILPPALAASADVRARFLREARTAAQLSHPNIVPIHRADERAGFAFFVMAWVDGETLGERIRRQGPLSAPLAAKILREVAWALAYANGRGIVHRDVKPDNILIERDTGRALVTDFGIAQVATDSSALTGAGLVLGSAQFMSPEQAAGERLDGRSDLYSLGAVAYFALTGRLPFEGDTIQAIMAKHITQEPPPLEIPAARPELTAAVLRALAKRPEDRFATGEEFAGALESVEPSELSIPLPLRSWLRPQTTAVVLTGAVYVGIGAVMLSFNAWRPTGSSWMLLLPMVLLLGSVVRETRAAFAAGFNLDDLRRVLRQDVERRAEERRYVDEAGRLPRSMEVEKGWWSRAVAWLIPIAIVVALKVPREWRPSAGVLGVLMALLMLPMLYETMTGGTKTSPKRWETVRLFGDPSPAVSIDPGTFDRLRSWFWASWFGRGVGALARIGLSQRVDPSSAMPTAEVIGLAVSELLAALPKDVRRRFVSAKDITQRLEGEAAVLRSRGDQPERLALVVSALENVRLDLLRLHAGHGDPDALEAALHAAEELGREVHRVLEAQNEADAIVARPPARADSRSMGPG